MIVRIPEGTWGMLYNHNGASPFFIEGQCYGLVISQDFGERGQCNYTVLLNDQLIEVAGEEVKQCKKTA